MSRISQTLRFRGAQVAAICATCFVWHGCENGDRLERTRTIVEGRLEVHTGPRNLTVGASFEIQGRAVPPLERPQPARLFADEYPFDRLEPTNVRPLESTGTTSDYFGFVVKPKANTRYQVRAGRFGSPVVHVFAGPRAAVDATAVSSTRIRFEFSVPVPRHLRVRRQGVHFYISRDGRGVFSHVGESAPLQRAGDGHAVATSEFEIAAPQGRDQYFACARQGVAIGMGRPRPPGAKHCGASRIVLDDGLVVPVPPLGKTDPLARRVALGLADSVRKIDGGELTNLSCDDRGSGRWRCRGDYMNGNISDPGTVYAVRAGPNGKVLTWRVDTDAGR